MIRVMIVAHHERREAWDLASTAARWLRERGHECWMPSAEAERFGAAR